MLFVLTGEIQTGKTRWLTRTLDELGRRGVNTCGVVAPGIWRQVEDASADGRCAYEKLGIDNVLYPGGELVHFALRKDIAVGRGMHDAANQDACERLGWYIDESALARVNRHFDDLAAGRVDVVAPSLLVVDELGRLELLRGRGLVAAMALLDRGPTPATPHACVVVRAELVDRAVARYADVWGPWTAIAPDDVGRDALFQAFGLGE